MLNFLRGMLIGVAGIGGISGGGIMFGSFSSNSVNIKRRDLEIISSGPVLTCEDSWEKYEFFLGVAGESEIDLGEGITLHVYKTIKNRLHSGRMEGKTKIYWGDKLAGRNNWENWKMTFTQEKINALWTKEAKKVYLSHDIIYSCQDKGQQKIQLLDSSRNQDDNKGIEGTDIKIKIEESTCKKVSDNPNLKECDIILIQNTNLRWKGGFQPKVRYNPSN